MRGIVHAKMPNAILVITFLMLAGISNQSRGDVVLSDDFEDGVLDLTKWSAPYGGVVEQDGVCRLTERRYLNTAEEYDPHVLPVAVSCEWRWLTSGDSFVVAMRSDGLRQGSYHGLANCVGIGLQGYANGRVEIIRAVDDVQTSLFLTEIPALTAVGVWHTLVFTDDGSSITCYFDGDFLATVEEDWVFATNLVTFYNREYSHLTMELDNVVIDRPGAIAVAGKSWTSIKALYR